MLKYSLAAFFLAGTVFAQNTISAEKQAAMKADLVGEIDHMKKQAQVMVDSVSPRGD